MKAVPLKGVSLADAVFEQLGREILTGALAPGEPVPTEHELSRVFGVNRHVVREALQRLEQIGLVATARGGRTRVLDFMRHAGLDLLATMAGYAATDSDTLRLWLSGLQMTSAISADVARLCAMRDGPAIAAELSDITAAMRAADTDALLLALSLEFWDVAITGSGNVAYRLAFNTLLHAIQVQPERSAHFARKLLETCDYHEPIVKAIAAGDGDSASKEARTAIGEALHTVELMEQAHRAALARVADAGTGAPSAARTELRSA